jgi:hypothetical protein
VPSVTRPTSRDLSPLVVMFFLNTVYTHIRMNTHSYKRMYTYPIFMSISERLSRLVLEIHEVGH